MLKTGMAANQSSMVILSNKTTVTASICTKSPAPNLHQDKGTSKITPINNNNNPVVVKKMKKTATDIS